MNRSEVIRKGYSDEEIRHIYALGKLFLENGQVHKSERIMIGLTYISPNFVPAWISLCYIYYISRQFTKALESIRQAHALEPSNPNVLVLLVLSLLEEQYIREAGTFLGELRELIELGEVESPLIERLYSSQVMRFELKEMRQDSLM